MFDDIWGKCIDTYGVESQMDMCIEECSELIDAIQKYRRGRVGKDEIVDELADVRIMCRQMELMFNCKDEVLNRIEYKAKRQIKRMEEQNG